MTALDVSDSLVDYNMISKNNMSFVLSDGLSIPVNNHSVDLAYSNQLLEHLHPEDVIEHMRNVKSVLHDGGVYYVATPHELTGPHDVSVYVGDVARGLHLKEYSYRSLAKLAKLTNFRSVTILLCRGERVVARLPLRVAIALEATISALLSITQTQGRESRIARFLFGIHAIFHA